MAFLLDLRFQDNKQVYAPGDKVVGNVVLTTEKNLLVTELQAHLRGKSYNCWFDYATRSCYTGEEYYLKATLTLWCKERSVTGDCQLSAGTHNFPFEYNIPKNAPCSFEGNAGSIRYSINITLKTPSTLFQKEKKVFLTVLPKADLNMDPRAKSNPHVELKERVGISNSKFVHVIASCNKGGYVPGEPIYITLDMNNSSDKDISKIKVIFEEKVTFYGSCLGFKKSKVEKREAAKKAEVHSVKGGQNSLWRSTMIVPSLPPSDLPGCSIIDMGYRLLFKLKCGTFSKIAFKIPIIIGTIPLKECQEPAPALTDEPPSYMECVFGQVDGVENEGEELLSGSFYSPMYSYYRWPNSNQP